MPVACHARHALENGRQIEDASSGHLEETARQESVRVTLPGSVPGKLAGAVIAGNEVKRAWTADRKRAVKFAGVLPLSGNTQENLSNR